MIVLPEKSVISSLILSASRLFTPLNLYRDNFGKGLILMAKYTIPKTSLSTRICTSENKPSFHKFLMAFEIGSPGIEIV